MTTIRLIISGATARAEVDGPLTSGMVGIPVTIEYDSAWDGLTRNLVCRSGPWYGPISGETRIILNAGTAATVAHEVMIRGRKLYLGVEGCNADGTVAIPTIWADCGEIYPGADSDADPSAEPTLPIWAQLQAEITELKESESDSSDFVSTAELEETLGIFQTENRNYVDCEIARVEAMISTEEDGDVIDLLEGVSLVNGIYSEKGLSFGSPNAMDNTVNTDALFEVSDFGVLKLIDTNYKMAFPLFQNGVVYSQPTAWITETELTKGSFLSLVPDALDGLQFTIQLRRVDGAAIYASSMDLSSIIEYTAVSQTQTPQVVDVIMFMGQSNMAGRGVTSDAWPETAPEIINGAGYEYRAISDNTRLYPMEEPFGVNENKSGGISEAGSKTGSMAVAFTNAYYTHNGKKPVVGVSASKGGSSIADWNNTYAPDAVQRLTDCVTFLGRNGYAIRHKFMLWCQGETDGDNGTSEAEYKAGFAALLATMKAAGIEKVFLVRIGNCNASGGETRYTDMIRWQTEIAQTTEDVVMVSADFAGMRERGLMKDSFHYYQAGYNECGTYAGINAAEYVNTGKEPVMYDPEDGSLYFSHKN